MGMTALAITFFTFFQISLHHHNETVDHSNCPPATHGDCEKVKIAALD